MIINCAWNTKKYQVMGTVTQYTQSIGSLQLLVLSAIERAAAVEYTGPVYFNIERTQLESEDIGNINNTYDRNAYYAEIFPLISYEPGEVPENVIFIQFFSDSISCTEARIWSNGSRIYCTYKHFGSSGTFVYSSDNIDTVSISSSPNYSGFAINGYAFNI